MKLFKKMATAASVALIAGSAYAAPFESYLVAGANVIEDDSNEYVFRANANGQGFTPVTAGNIQVGDLVVQILDFPIINGINIDSATDELTGVGMNVVTALSASSIIDPPGSTPAYTAVDITFAAASAAIWNAFGFAHGLGDNVATLLFYDQGNDLNVNTQGLLTTLNTAANGTLVMALGLIPGNPDNFIAATDSALDVSTYLLSAGETAGVTPYGGFTYGLTVLFEGLAGTTVGGVEGSGTTIVTNRPLITGVIDDTQASFNYVPEPGSLALMGLGLFGLGALRRRNIA